MQWNGPLADSESEHLTSTLMVLPETFICFRRDKDLRLAAAGGGDTLGISIRLILCCLSGVHVSVSGPKIMVS